MAAFVGRAGELRQLTDALDTARAGAGATVLVAGEAGIGKTRLGAEVAAHARATGCEVLLGRSLDLVGTDLPYQPFVEALRPLGALSWMAGSQLHMFEQTLAALTARAPVLLQLEDLHWADASTLDLLGYLAHHLDGRRVLLAASYRPDEPSSGARMRRLAENVRRSGSALLLDLGPLPPAEMRVLLAARAPAPLPADLSDEIVTRAEGNPFFAEELIDAAGGPNGTIPSGLRDLLLRRVTRLDPPTQDLLRLAAAAGRDVGYPLLRALTTLPERELRESLRRAIGYGVLVPVSVGGLGWKRPGAGWPPPPKQAPATGQSTGRLRFRHALLAEAIYATILLGEAEELHTRLAEELSRGPGADPAELAPHWSAAGRGPEALAASIAAARQAEAMFGLAEAHAHLERALAWWPAVPDAPGIARIDLAELCTWAAGLADKTGAAPRALELARQAVALVGETDLPRAALLHVRLGEYLHDTGGNEAGLAALRRAVDLVPVQPPSPERAYALGSLAGGLMVAWRHAESLPICEEALQLARQVAAGQAEVRALTVLGADLAYLGRGAEGVAHLRHALRLAEEIGDHLGLERAYVNLTDALTMLGRNRESAREGRAGLDAMRRYGIDSTLLVANQVEALLAIGEWDDADRLSAAALRGTIVGMPCQSLVIRADIEIGRGAFAAARAHLDAARATLRADRALGRYDAYLVELALGERRWTDAHTAVEQGLAQADRPAAAQIRVQICAVGLRAQAELAALARARRDADTVRLWLAEARKLIAVARRAAAEASAITPLAAGWLALAEAEHDRAVGTAQPDPRPAGGIAQPGPRLAGGIAQSGPRLAGGIAQPEPWSAGGIAQSGPWVAGGVAQPEPRLAGGIAQSGPSVAGGVARVEPWSAAAEVWGRLDRPQLVAYCRWREAEALVEAGASRARASGPLREARVIAARLGAGPLLGEIDLLAGRARLDLAPPATVPPEAGPGLAETLGLTPREAEVLTLIARGCTNRQIATTLVISVRTAGVHVSHILSKLGAPNRQAAAAIADRLRVAPR